MGVSETALAAIQAPTPPEEVKHRQGPGGKTLAYVDARYVQEVLDNNLGPQNWQRDHRLGADGKVSCGVGINVEGVGWVWKWDGAGETDIEGEKGAFSDAFKRAAVNWGIARDLYSDNSPAARSAPSPAPARRAAPSSPPEEPPFDPVALAEQVFGEDGLVMDNGRCPTHGKPWTHKVGTSKAGKAYDFWACSGGKPGAWCQERPDAEWVRRQR